MTESEFKRYEKAVEIKEKINETKNFLNYLKSNFEDLDYPRSESSWCLHIYLNDDPKSINLTSKLFWECFEFVKHKKEEELKEYENLFKEL